MNGKQMILAAGLAVAAVAPAMVKPIERKMSESSPDTLSSG